MRCGFIIVALIASGCGGASSGSSAAGAAVLGSLAAASAVASRAAGGCYAECTHGTICNTATGLCERLPCGGTCEAGQACDPVTDTCTALARTVPVEVIRMLAYGTWGWPYGPWLTYGSPYWDPYRVPASAAARPPGMDPGDPTQAGLPPGN